MTDLLPIKEAVYEMSLFFNQQPDDERITAYAKALSNYTPKQIIYAFKQVIGSGSAFFPSLAEILKHLRPIEETRDDRANAIVAELFLAIKNFGQYDELKMIETLSEDARLTLSAMGGTSELRNAPAENIGTTRAQLRDLAKSVIASKYNTNKAQALERIGINTGKVLGFKTIDFSNYLPEVKL